MNITIKPELEKLVLSLVERGMYENVDQVIEAAVIFFERESQNYDYWIEEVRPKIQVGLEQLERGEKMDGELVIAQLQEKLKQDNNFEVLERLAGTWTEEDNIEFLENTQSFR